MEIINGKRTREVTIFRGNDSHFVKTPFLVTISENDSFLLCNTATGELLKLNDEEYSQYSGDSFTDDILKHELVKRRFLVEENINEFVVVDEERKRYYQQFYNDTHPIKSFTILPTTRCNARCFYCYESGICQKNMTVATGKRVVEFITEKSRGEKVQLSWFGGEPTVARHIISLICSGLKANNVAFDSSMITNGLLLDETLISEACDLWKLSKIQITIDGTEGIYFATKNYKGCVKDPFYTVLLNIENALSRGIHVSVRVNLGMHNREDVEALLQILKQRFSKAQHLSIYVHEINNCYSEDVCVELKKKAQKLNFALCDGSFQEVDPLPSIRLHYCMADSPSAILINPEGGLGKCEHYPFEKLIGNICDTQTGYDKEMEAQWRQRVNYPNCSKCPLYPSCAKIKLCNGGISKCTDEMVELKKEMVMLSMRTAYYKWKVKMDAFRNRDRFQIKHTFEVNADNTVISFLDTRGNKTEIPVNNEALDILHYLKDPHTYRETSEMLYFDYDITKERAETDTENYILQLLQYGFLTKVSD